ncbi:MAG: hypothetical protein QGD93_10300 [Actinomycetota bacterium]|nr:hypothetical protein [Actinomycetota bacterium]
MGTLKSRHEGSLHVTDNLSMGTLSIPSGTIVDAAVGASAAISATKMQHQHSMHYGQVDGGAVAVAISPIYTCRGATATIVAVQVVCVDAPDGGDLAFSVDLKKYDEDTPAPATVLSAPISYSSTQSDGEVEAGTVSSPSLVAGDSLLVVVAVSGSSGTQGQGLGVTVTIREDAE